MKNGVPFDVAFSLDAEDRLNMVVIFGTFEGGSFDWSELRWRGKDEG